MRSDGDATRVVGLSPGKIDRAACQIDAPDPEQRFLRPRTLEREHRHDRLDVRHIEPDQPVAHGMTLESDPPVVEWDRLELHRRQIVPPLPDVNARL